jgi:Type II secretion system (T2SS), protein E, N-terminal domain
VRVISAHLAVSEADLSKPPAPPGPPPWQWPVPPSLGQRAALPPLMGAQPCLVEMQSGDMLRGEMLAFDPARRRLSFRADAAGPEASLPFASLRRLTLTRPLPRLGRAAQERDYRLQQVDAVPVPPIAGRSAGAVEGAEGMYLFQPCGDDGSLQRVFVPRSAYSRCEFGASAEELAARHWIASPAQLVQALAQQPAQPAQPLGHSLLALGLLTPRQLQQAQQRVGGKAALGESLVAEGLLSRADLQTALAHRMGFALVDLQRFPLDPAALALLPLRLASSHRVLPLMRHEQRLVVAVDRPGRVLKLSRLQPYAQMPIAPVLALKAHILLALERQTGEVWNLNP